VLASLVLAFKIHHEPYEFLNCNDKCVFSTTVGVRPLTLNYKLQAETAKRRKATAITR